MKQLTRNERRQLDKLAPHIEQLIETDRVWFEQNPDRQHRVRHTGEAELADMETRERKLMRAPPDCRWFTIVRNVLPGHRIRIFATHFDDAETGLDVSEDFAREAFDALAHPGVQNLEAAMRAFGQGGAA
jgi:hypothetical protein